MRRTPRRSAPSSARSWTADEEPPRDARLALGDPGPRGGVPGRYRDAGADDRRKVVSDENAMGVARTFLQAMVAFWSKVNRNGPVSEERPDLGRCWLWRGSTSRLGYGHLFWDKRYRPSHAVAYELVVGPIPEGLEIDHLCRVPSCVRPTHLEPITHRENVIVRGRGPWAARAAQTRCLRGHPLSGENVYIHKSRGVRVCRTCHRDNVRVTSQQRRVRKREVTA
jgi:hypothetical protein